jgi:RNA polymerase sigma factor (sigma-70 family)
MTPEQERRYIQQAQTDPQAFVHLYDHYFPRIHAYVCYRVHSLQDAEDVIADTFFRAIRELKRFKWRNAGSFAAWLFRIAHNRVVDHYRQYERAAVSSEPDENLVDLASRAPLPEEVLAQQETFRQMRGLIATLSPRRQEVITLRFFGGLRNNEIADVLGLDEHTVAAHLSRGLQDLRGRATHVRSDAMAETAV